MDLDRERLGPCAEISSLAVALKIECVRFRVLCLQNMAEIDASLCFH